MPAEWERHEATWIGWPHNASDWPTKFPAIPHVFAEMVKKISTGEKVRILVESDVHREQAAKLLTQGGVALEQIEYFLFPTNRGWTRDLGPIFVKTNDRVAIARFLFNGWAKYPDWQKDNAVPLQAARALKVPLTEVLFRGQPVVLEGGSIDVNGAGTLVTTEECLLDSKIQVRNPGFTREDFEGLFDQFLGTPKVLWLGKGIAGDDTHGHVDDLCRFVTPRTLVMIRERNASDENYQALEENWERVQGFRLQDGSKPDAVELPCPAPVYFDGERLPASYANFYISNAAVIVPTFNDPKDRLALGILSELITDRPVVGIHALDLVEGYGTLHCLTQQQPNERS